MVKLTRTINSLWRFFIILSLLIAWCDAFAFFKRPEWLHFQKKEVNFWSKMSEDFAIQCDDSNPHIQQQIRWYQQHPKYLQHILKRSEPFIYYVYEQTRRRNLPAELALIPIIESDYNPDIGSHSGAVGLWQIMPGTATKFGLKINHSYDGRRDVSASTKAALTYLSYLHRYFNKNWLLALAAYDAGEGKVQSVARRHNNFWEMPFSRETKEYVPKLLAIAQIIKQHQNYHISLPQVTNQPTLRERTWHEASVINISETARDLGIDDETFRQYNPGIRKEIANVPHNITFLIPGDSNTILEETTAASLPIENQTATNYRGFLGEQQNQQVTIEPPQILASAIPKAQKNAKKGVRYRIRSGDNLTTIAKKFHITVKALKQVNPIIRNEKQLKIGYSLIIPDGG